MRIVAPPAELAGTGAYGRKKLKIDRNPPNRWGVLVGRSSFWRASFPFGREPMIRFDLFAV